METNEDKTLTDGYSLALDIINGWGESFNERLPNIIAAAVLFVLMLAVAFFIRKVVKTSFSRQKRDDLGLLLSDFVFWGLMLFSALLTVTIIFPSIKPVDMFASLGIGSLVIGFAFKDILQNWFSGLLILLRMPFRRGDQVKIGDAEGTVARIEPRATIIRTYDGRDLVIPNTTVYTSLIEVNTSQELRRTEIDFTVGYAYDIRKMTTIIQNALEQVEEILQDPPPQILCWELGSTSLAMKVRWWINSERSAEVVSRSRAVQAMKEAFDANDIDPTDPQLIYYKNVKTADGEPFEAGVASKEASAQGLTDEISKTPPPPQIKTSINDPEADAPKIDSKERTMLG
jgi:small conductance mechanosensitive channel